MSINLCSTLIFIIAKCIQGLHIILALYNVTNHALHSNIVTELFGEYDYGNYVLLSSR